MMPPRPRAKGAPAALRRIPLREVGVTVQTRRRYEARVREFLLFLDSTGRPWPRSAGDVDRAAEAYIEHLWASGAPEAAAVEVLSALARLVPALRRALPISAFLIANWRRSVRRERAEPFAPQLARAVAGVALSHDQHSFALAVLVGFVGLLRPSELFNLEVGDIVFPPRGVARCVLVLRNSKSGRRNSCEEKVLLHERWVV